MEISQRLGQAGSWAKSTQCPFFPSGDRVLVLHRMVGRSWRRVLTPGYFDRVAFLQTLCVRISESPPHPHTVSSSPPLKSTRVSSLLQLSLLPLMMQNVSQGFDLQLKCLSIKYASSGKDESFAPDRMCQKRVTEFELCYIKLVYWTVSINSCSLSTISPSTTLDAGNFMVYMKKFIILATC